MALPLIIFDCDGVLVDTEGLANAHLAKMFGDFGYTLDAEEFRARFQGKTMAEVCSDVETATGAIIDPSEVRRSLNGALETGVKAVPGVETLVSSLVEHSYPICVASNGTYDKMRTTLSQTRLMAFVHDVLFSADDVACGKPSPDLFEFAARKMGHAAKDAIIIEDSLSGVKAGVSAGARVLGYCGDPFTNKEELAASGAAIFDDMQDALALIKNARHAVHHS